MIVSDQRMPGMTGMEFLRSAKNLYPDTARIVLSEVIELQSVTDAVNEGAIYKFLTKPWDDAQRRGHSEAAFAHKEMADDMLFAFANQAALALYADGALLLGADARGAVPDLVAGMEGATDGGKGMAELKGRRFEARAHRMWRRGQVRGVVIMLLLPMAQEGDLHGRT